MHVVFDAFAVRPGSAAITLDNLLRGWLQLPSGDRLTVLAAPDHELALPDGVPVEVVTPPRLPGAAGTVWLRSLGVRRACRRLGADGLVSAVTASAFAGAPCPRGAIVYDLRHERRPDQFPRSRRIVRRVSYGYTFRRADALFCISYRTRDDLLRGREWLREKVVVARYGAEHADAWTAGPPAARPYALAFGQFANKNVDKVLDAWAQFCSENSTMSLRLVGMGKADRAGAAERVARLGIADRVELAPWLDDAAFVQTFAGASLIVFPSDFEGFGLPAVEAMRLRIPLVVSADPALAEVTGGHAAVAHQLDPKSLAAAMHRALTATPAELDAAYEHTEQFTWRGMAAAIRAALARPRR
jgi:glycosyltransferase involved in cell wall biosynthesis